MRKDSKVMFGRHFLSLNRTSCCQSRGTEHKTNNKISGKRLLRKLQYNGKRFQYKLSYKPFNDLPNTINFLRVTLAAVNKTSSKNVATILHDLFFFFFRKHITIYSGT